MNEQTNRLKILFVEDDANDVLLMQRAIQTVWPDAVFTTACTENKLLSALLEASWSALIVDYNVPGLSFESVLKHIISIDSNLPVIMVSGVADSEAALKAMRSGAWDFVGKDTLDFLPTAIEHVLNVAQVRREAQSSRLQFDKLFNLVPMPVFVYDMGEKYGDGRIVEMNERFCSLVGRSREQLMDSSLLDMIPRSCHKALQDNRPLFLEHEELSFDSALLNSDGDEIAVEAISRKCGLNGKTTALVILQDLSKRNASDKRRIKLMNGLKQVVFSAGELLKCPDFDSVCKKAIDLGREALGLDRCAFFLCDGDDLVGTYGTDAKGNTADEKHIRVARRDDLDRQFDADNKRWVHLDDVDLYAQTPHPGTVIGRGWHVSTPIRDERGKTWAIIMNDAALSHEPYDEDVQEVLYIYATILGGMLRRKEAEEALAQSKAQLRQSQKMEALGRLAGGVAHDFNNLLTSIMGYCELISEGLGEGHPFYEDVQEVSHAGRRAAELTQRLLAFSRKQITEVHSVDVKEVIMGLEKLLARTLGEDIELKILLHGESSVVMGDEGLLENVLMNLVVNARDAMPTGGTLTICTSCLRLTEDQKAKVVNSATDEFVSIEVQDTGCGIDQEVLEHIFEPFFTTKNVGAGTGLGLSTVYGIIKQMKGYVEVRTEKGSGTNFTIYLPRTDEKSSISRRVDKVVLPEGREVVLIIEDEIGVRRLASRILSELGYTVLEAGNAGEALLLCEQRTLPIDLVLSDVVMPQLSGPETVERLLHVRQDFRVLYMTGFTQEAIVSKGVVEEDAPVILKPFTRENLARKVRQILDKPQA